MNVLAIDTAAAVCGVALWCNGEVVVSESDEPRAHAKHVLAQVRQVLADGGLALTQLDRYAFGRGPGGLTGVRVAASAVQGLACAIERPVVAVSNLQAMAQNRGRDGDRIVACMDAGMGQIYAGFYHCGEYAMPIGDESLIAPEALDWPAGTWRVLGNGAASLPSDAPVLAERELHARGAVRDIALLAARPDAHTVAALQAQPKYWRHPVTG